MDTHLPLPVFLDLSIPETTKKTNTQAIALQTYGDTKVQQVDARNLPEHTKALLKQLMEADNTLQINHRLCSYYYGDGKDFSIYYKVLLARSVTIGKQRKRKIQQRETNDYSQEVYNQAKGILNCILKGFIKIYTAACVYNAYNSILEDMSIEQQHRLDILNSIENKAMRFWILKSLQSPLSCSCIPADLVDAAMKTLWKSLELEPSGLAEDFFYIFLSTDPAKRREALETLLATQEYPWDQILEMGENLHSIVSKLALDLQPLEKPFIEVAQSFSYYAYHSTLKNQSLKLQPKLDRIATINNKAVQFWILKSLQSSLTQNIIPKDRIDAALGTFLENLEIEPSPCAETLVYTFLDTEPEKRKEVLFPILEAHINQQGEKIDWANLTHTAWDIDRIVKKLEVDSKNWSQPFIELAEDNKLPVELRLYAYYYVLDNEKFIELKNAFFQDSTMLTTLEFWRAFLSLGHEKSFMDFLNEPPEKYSLSSFDLMQQGKMHAIEALKEFYELKKTDLFRLGGKLEDIEALSNKILNLSKSKNEIEHTYPLYKIILEKRTCKCSLGAILEAKKANLISTLEKGILQVKNISLNEKAYILPKVLDPEWVEGYEDITFNFFIETIEALMHEKQEHQALIVRDAALHQDYRALFQSWYNILTDPNYGVIKSLLDVQDADDNPYVLKLTALAAGIIQLFKEGVANEAAYNKARGFIDILVLNTQTCYGGQLQAIDKAYALFKQENYRYIEDPKERAIDIVLNSLYLIRKNWVMEDEVRYTKKGKMVYYSPNVADGVFINALSRYLDKTELMDRYECDEEELETYTFLKNRTSKQDHYGRTHIGYDILGIVGPEIGLSPQGAPAVYDLNIEAESWFLKNTVSDKVSLVSAFVESFTFENIWEPLAELVWKKAAEESSFGRLVYKDEGCTQTLNSSDLYEDAEGIIARQDPLAKGILRLLNTLGLDPDACCETMQVYYKDPLYDEVSETIIYVRLTQEGIALVLDKLGFLSVEAGA